MMIETDIATTGLTGAGIGIGVDIRVLYIALILATGFAATMIIIKFIFTKTFLNKHYVSNYKDLFLDKFLFLARHSKIILFSIYFIVFLIDSTMFYITEILGPVTFHMEGSEGSNLQSESGTLKRDASSSPAGSDPEDQDNNNLGVKRTKLDAESQDLESPIDSTENANQDNIWSDRIDTRLPLSSYEEDYPYSIAGRKMQRGADGINEIMFNNGNFIDSSLQSHIDGFRLDQENLNDLNRVQQDTRLELSDLTQNNINQYEEYTNPEESINSDESANSDNGDKEDNIKNAQDRRVEALDTCSKIDIILRSNNQPIDPPINPRTD